MWGGLAVVGPAAMAGGPAAGASVAAGMLSVAVGGGATSARAAARAVAMQGVVWLATALDRAWALPPAGSARHGLSQGSSESCGDARSPLAGHTTGQVLGTATCRQCKFKSHLQKVDSPAHFALCMAGLQQLGVRFNMKRRIGVRLQSLRGPLPLLPGT